MEQTGFEENIVISGIAGVFPNCKNVAEFYSNVINKKQLFSNVDPYWETLIPGVIPIIGQQPLQRKFDAGFFGVHYKQAEEMHQSCRKLLELSVEVIMDSGINPLDLKGSNTGVFLSNLGVEAKSEWIWQNPTSPTFGMLGSTSSAMAEQVSYYLQLQGPSVSIDSACSSSLYTLDHAVAAIKSGRCDSALVCAINAIQNPNVHFAHQLLGVLETNGKSNVFEESCNGFIRSEATAVIFVQKLKDARRSYAEILNIKTNCDGFKENGITYPSIKSMATLFREVYDEVGVDPASVDFIECHVTGTNIGFVQEIQAVEKAFCSNRKIPLFVGSIKANIGHCEGVSGLASLIKILVGLQHNCILPNPNCSKVKSQVKAVENGKIKIATEYISLPDKDIIIGCNNFGLGGTNAHLALKHHNRLDSMNQQRGTNRLVCFSARTMLSLTKITNSIADNPSEDYIRLLQNIFRRKISNHWYRGYTIINNGEIIQNSRSSCNEKSQLCLTYPHGSTDWLKLFESMPKTTEISKSINRIQNILLPKGVDVVLLWKQTQELHFGDLVVATVALQIVITDALKDLLQARITCSTGSSSGVITSAYASGTLELENAILLAFELRNRFKKSNQLKNTESDVVKELNSLCQSTTESNGEILCINNPNLKVTPNMVQLLVGPGEKHDQLSCCPKTTLLDILGRLYLLGFDLQLDKLYTGEAWPVKAPFISPLIEWQHQDDWHVLKYQLGYKHKSVVTISLDDNNWKFLSGHVIDGRNIFPATAYLYIVWTCYLRINRLLLEKTKIIFENVKFQRMTFLSKQKPIILTVDITNIQDNFEIREGDECLVTGKIRSFNTSIDNTTNFIISDETTPQKMMYTMDIYKKLHLHGYNYKNNFCCLQEANLDGTVGAVNWNNWITFLDAILHFTVINKILDDLYVPTSIDQIYINFQEHAQALVKHNQVLPVYYDQNSNIISAPGVEIRNALVSSIRKRSEQKPNLEVYKFVPFDTELSLEDSVMVHSQLVGENLDGIFRAIEVVDSFSKDTYQDICPLIEKALGNGVGVNGNFNIYSTKFMDYPNITVENKNINDLPKNVNLVIISHGSKRPNEIAQILEGRNCFILSRESTSFQPFTHMEVISIHRTSFESLVLLRKRCNIAREVIYLESDLVWLGQLQSALTDNKKVLLVAQNDLTSGILGLINCLKQEIEENVSCVFLLDIHRKFNIENEFYQKQLKKNLLVNVFKNGVWGSYRHLPLHENKKDCSHALCVTISGDLSTVAYIQGPLTRNSSALDETLIDIYYAGVNFKDVMTATGRINFSVSKQYRTNLETIGLEFVGKISSGERVMGLTSKCTVSNTITVGKSIMCSVPQHWSMEDAATVPSTYITVLYALLKISKLKHGQNILIHSGTGGIGQSAINVALHYNCNIFTTVGSMEKRNYLKTLFPAIPDSHIGNSRDTTFEQMVLKQTKGKGVEIILNSLSEEKLHVSTQCLARKGIFIELGKYDSLINSSFPLNKFTNGCTYTGIHMDMFFEKDSITKEQLAPLLQNGIKEGYVKPLPRVVYDKDKVQDALHYMSLGKHTGKILVKLKDESISTFESITAKPRFFCDANKLYIIIGGLGGFGLEFVDWLIERGAKKLVLVSRSGVTTGYQNFKLSYWRKLDCKVLVLQNDLTKEKECIKLLTKCNTLGVVDGIFNLSLVLYNALINNQTEESFKTALAPKALITSNMDSVSQVLCPCLKKFVVFSSIACGRGNSGQTNYGMANSIMERICEQRKRNGYPALAIQWGLIGDVGYVAENLSKNISINGLLTQTISSCLNVLDALLSQEEVIVCSTVFAGKKIKQKPKFQDFLDAVVEILAITNIKHISMHSKLSSLGMDSTSVVQLRQFLGSECNLYLTQRELRNITLHMLTEMNRETIE